MLEMCENAENNSSSLVCRICLKSCGTDCMSLFEPYKSASISQLILFIVDLKFIEGDGYPGHICKVCIVDFETALNFKERCETSNKILKEKKQNIPIFTIIKAIKKEEPDYFDEVPSFDDNISADEILNEDIAVKLENCSNQLPKHTNEVLCHDCGGIFKSKCKLRVHWKKVHKLTAQTCQLCKRIFKSFYAYRKHLQTIERKPCVNTKYVTVIGEGRSRIYQCTKCDYHSQRPQAIRYHTVIHSGLKQYKCEICSKSFTQIGSLFGHKESIHKEYRKEITCQYCGKFVQGRGRIYLHLKQHDENRTKYQCDVCKIFLKTRNSIICHLKRHSGTKSLTCEVCAASFYTSSDLANHKRTRHSTNPKVNTWYKCDVCDYKSNNRYVVKRHKSKHTNSNMACPKCGMFFDDILKMQKHQRVHFGERKYACPLCDAKFLHRDGRHKHIKFKHNPQIPKPIRKVKTVKKESEERINSVAN